MKQYGKGAQTLLKSEICTTAPLSSLLTTAKAMDLEKVSLIDMPNLGTAC